MKNIKYLAIVTLLALSLASCDKETEGLTDITYYPVITLEGGDVLMGLGENYVDPDYTADLGGEDVTSQVVVTDNIDNSSIGVYQVSYTVTNSYGFSSTVTRNVIVYDPTVNVYIGGTYETDMNATLYGTAGRTFAEYAAAYGNTDQCVGITWTEIAPGFYYINDLFGGWYEQIRAYGARYAMTAYVSVDNDYNIELLDSYIAGWGDSVDYIDGGIFDPETGTINYFVSYAGQIFMDIVLNRVSE